eukprot:g4411.t1
MTKRKQIKRLSHIGKGLERVRDVIIHFDCSLLKSLNLHANCIESFEGLLGLTSLKDLNLSANHLTTLSGFPRLTALESLNLASNGITSVEGIPLLPSLESLNLAHNRIGSLRGLELFKEGKLSALDLRDNLLESVEVFGSLSEVDTLKSLRFTGSANNAFSLATEDVSGLETYLIEMLPQLELLEGEKFDRVLKQKQTLSPSSSNYVQNKNPMKKSMSFEAPCHEGSPVIQYTPQPVQRMPLDHSIVVGYPAQSPIAVSSQSAEPSKEKGKEFVDRVNVGVDPIFNIETLDKGVETCCEDFCPKTYTASVQVEIESNEVLRLKEDLCCLESQLKQTKVELSNSQQKQEGLQREFLLKIKALKQLSAEKMRHVIAEEASKAKTNIKNAENKAQSLREELKRTLTDTQQLAKKYTVLEQHLTQEKEAKSVILAEKEKLERDGNHQKEATDKIITDLESKHKVEVFNLKSEVSSLSDQLINKEQTIENFQDKLKKVSEDLESLQNQSKAEEEFHNNQVKTLQNEITKLENKVNSLMQVKEALEKDLQQVGLAREEEKNVCKEDITRLEGLFAEKISQESTRALKEGEANGRRSMKLEIEQEIEKLKTSFKSVESKFKATLNESETEKTKLMKHLKSETGKLTDLKNALQYSMERSQKQDAIVREMKSVIEAQKLSIQEMKSQLSLQSQKLKETDPHRLEALEQELASSKLALKEFENIKEEASILEKSLSEKNAKLKSLLKEQEARDQQVERDFHTVQEELLQLRSNKNELTQQIKGLKLEVQTLQDSVQIKEKMLDSANMTISDLKEERREFQNELKDLRTNLEEYENELSSTHDRNEQLNEALQREKEDKEKSIERLDDELSKEKQTVKTLKEKLNETETEFEKKSKLIHFAEKEISKCKVKYEEKLQKLEAERTSAVTQLAKVTEEELTSKTKERELLDQLNKSEERCKTEMAKLQKLQIASTRCLKENKALRDRVYEVESDMKELLSSIDRERTHSRRKIDQLEHISRCDKSIKKTEFIFMAIRIPNNCKFAPSNLRCFHQTVRYVTSSRVSPIRPSSSNVISSLKFRLFRGSFTPHEELDRSFICHAASGPDNPSILSSLKHQFQNLSTQWRSVFPMCSLFFFMAFINTIINGLALSMVVTASGGGAFVIPYLNVYAVLPASVLFTVVYAYAAHHISRDQLFNIVIVSFGLILCLFCFVIYPNHQFLHLNALADSLTRILPTGLQGGIGMIRNWTFTLFYCLAELWGDVGLSLLFWGFANDITHLDHAPLLYPLFGIGANLAQMLGGLMLKYYSASSCFAKTFKSLTLQMLACIGIILILHQWISSSTSSKESKPRWKLSNKKGSPNGRMMMISWRESSHQGNNNNRTLVKPRKKKQQQKSFKDSLQFLTDCPQIRCLGIMTIAQGLAITLMELLWKYHLKIAYPTPEAFAAFLGEISTVTGFVTCGLMLMSPILFSRFRWGEVAKLTPRLLTYGGLVFFGACLAFHMGPILDIKSISELMITPIILGGSVLYVVARGAKFSLFKPAEEMIYITLDEESRTKGKAAVDVVGAQIGKSGGSIVQQALLMLSGGRLLSITPIMVASYFYMLKIWIKAVADLDARKFIIEQTRKLNASDSETKDSMGETKKDDKRVTLSLR